MGLIKSQSAPSALAPFSMTDIAKQAAGILARAQSRADAMLVEAQRAAEELRLTARTEGLIAGQREGIAHGLKEGRETGRGQALDEQRNDLTAVVATLTAACSEMNDRRREMEAGVLREVVDLALKIAARIVKRQGELDPTILERNLAESLKLVTKQVRVFSSRGIPILWVRSIDCKARCNPFVAKHSSISPQLRADFSSVSKRSKRLRMYLARQVLWVVRRFWTTALCNAT